MYVGDGCMWVGIRYYHRAWPLYLSHHPTNPRQITPPAARRAPRSVVELSRGDQLRRETQRRLLALKAEQERARECTFECVGSGVFGGGCVWTAWGVVVAPRLTNRDNPYTMTRHQAGDRHHRQQQPAGRALAAASGVGPGLVHPARAAVRFRFFWLVCGRD